MPSRLQPVRTGLGCEACFARRLLGATSFAPFEPRVAGPDACILTAEDPFCVAVPGAGTVLAAWRGTEVFDADADWAFSVDDCPRGTGDPDGKLDLR